MTDAVVMNDPAFIVDVHHHAMEIARFLAFDPGCVDAEGEQTVPIAVIIEDLVKPPRPLMGRSPLVILIIDEGAPTLFSLMEVNR